MRNILQRFGLYQFVMIVCLGEFVVDFISTDLVDDMAHARIFHKCMGGSPANVAAGLHTLGVPVKLTSKLGRDPAGRFLRAELEKLGMSDNDVATDPFHPTRCVFIAYDPEGVRNVAVANRQSADQHLKAEDLTPDVLDGGKVLHMSGTVFLSETIAQTAISLIHRAKRDRLLVSLDPNISLRSASSVVLRRLSYVLPLVDILKVNRDEMNLLVEKGLLDKETRGINIITAGEEGAWLHTQDHEIFVPPEKTSVIDPTGAGDAFLAGVLGSLYRSELPATPSIDDLSSWGTIAARLAAGAIRHIGATSVYLPGK